MEKDNMVGPSSLKVGFTSFLLPPAVLVEADSSLLC